MEDKYKKEYKELLDVLSWVEETKDIELINKARLDIELFEENYPEIVSEYYTGSVI